MRFSGRACVRHYYSSGPQALVLSAPRATLKLPAAGQKTVWWLVKIGLFTSLPPAALFSANFPVSCQFRVFLSLVNGQKHSFLQFLRIMMSWREVNIDHPLYTELNNLIVFWVIFIILRLKNTQIWEIGRMITLKIWASFINVTCHG